MKKNTSLSLILIIIGLIIGYNFSSLIYPHGLIKGIYFSNTKAVIDRQKFNRYVDLNYQIEIKDDNVYEFSWVNLDYGVNTSGKYSIEGNNITFDQVYYDLIVRDNYELDYFEKLMTSESSRLSDNKLVYFILDDGSILIFALEVSLYFEFYH